MASSRDVSNPLRPYYIPPTIGLSTDPVPNNASGTAFKTSAGSRPSFSFPDVDYSSYLSDTSPSIAASVKELLDKAVWKYASILMAQPFEVAKMILQVYVAENDASKGVLVGNEKERRNLGVEQEDEDDYANSSDDEPNFFTSASPVDDFYSSRSPTPTRGRRGRRHRHYTDHPVKSSSRTSASSPHHIVLKNPHSLLDAISSLSSNSGALAVWRGTNTTFIYTVLSRTLETFFRGVLAAIFGIADGDISVPAGPGALSDTSVLTSTAPMAAVIIATASCALSSLILAPIDAARTRLILTPSSHPPRSLLATLHTLSPSYLTPAHLIPITFLTSTIPSLISNSSPLLLKTYLKIDPALNPTSWSIATFATSAFDLAIKFPLETVLRRAQIATWTAPSGALPPSSSSRKAVETIVPVPQAYRGILPTVWSIVREEGTSLTPQEKAALKVTGKASVATRKGQGFGGLYRGWRVGMWGLVGVWGAAFVGGLQFSGEGAAEGLNTHGGKF